METLIKIVVCYVAFIIARRLYFKMKFVLIAREYRDTFRRYPRYAQEDILIAFYHGSIVTGRLRRLP